MRFWLAAGWCWFGLAALSAAPTAAEKELYQNGKRAFTEGIFDLADQRFDVLLKKFPETDYKMEVRLLQARALYYLGRTEEALALLDLPAKQISADLRPDFIFWQAEAWAALKKWSEAEDKYRELIAQFPKEEQILAAQLGLAWALLQQGREEEAKQRLENLSGNQNKNGTGQQAALILAKYALTKNQASEAINRLQALLKQNPASALMFEAHYWLAEALYQEHKAKEALEHYQKITGNPRASPKSLVAEAWFGSGRAYQPGQPDKAMGAFEKAYTLGEAEALKLSAFKLYLQSAATLKQLPEGIKNLQEYAQKNQNQPNNAAALLAIGLAWSEAQEPDKAVATLESMLLAYPQSRWRAPAQLELGKIYLAQKRTEDAVKMLSQAAETKENNVIADQANFQLGQVLVTRKDYATALQAFQKVTGTSLAEQAGFQILSLYAQQQNLEAFTKKEEEFRRQFPQSDQLAALSLLNGRLLEKAGKKEEARQLYQKAIAALANNPQRPVLLARLANMLYQNNQIEEALPLYEQFIEDYKDHPLLPKVAYEYVLASNNSGKTSEEQAIQTLQELLKRYPKASVSPDILFHIGALYYNRHDYVNAHRDFERVLQDYPGSDSAEIAPLFAARASYMHHDLESAVALLEKVPEKSKWKTEARLLQGEVYHLKLRFSDALTIFDAVLTQEKSGDLFVKALLSKGECLFALAGKDKNSANYDLAAAAYGLLLTSNQGNLSQRNEAGYKRAKCFEKLNRSQDALDLYLQVLDGRMAPDGQAPAVPEFKWQISSGQDAGQIYEAQQNWKAAIGVYQRLVQLGGPTQQEFKDRINRIRRDNFIYDNS
jgi:tetratricopeptide (TPR) repeat protein